MAPIHRSARPGPERRLSQACRNHPFFKNHTQPVLLTHEHRFRQTHEFPKTGQILCFLISLAFKQSIPE